MSNLQKVTFLLTHKCNQIIWTLIWTLCSMWLVLERGLCCLCGVDTGETGILVHRLCRGRPTSATPDSAPSPPSPCLSDLMPKPTTDGDNDGFALSLYPSDSLRLLHSSSSIFSISCSSLHWLWVPLAPLRSSRFSLSTKAHPLTLSPPSVNALAPPYHHMAVACVPPSPSCLHLVCPIFCHHLSHKPPLEPFWRGAQCQVCPQNLCSMRFCCVIWFLCSPCCL